MKKNNLRLFILIIIVFFFTGIIFIKQLISSYKNQNVPKPFRHLKKEEINEVILYDDKKETKIYKNKTGWHLKKDGIEYPADQERLDLLLENFINLQKEEIASNNKEKHSDFGIGKRKILVKSKSQSFSLYIGNPTGLNKNYLRVNNEDELFIASGFADAFYPEDFRDLKVKFIHNEDKVSDIKIVFDYQEITLFKKDSNWYLKDKKLKKEKIDFFLNDLKTLKASDIIINPPLLTNPALTINLKENNKEKTADFFSKDTDSYFLKTSETDKIYLIDKISVDQLKKQEKDFTEE